MSVSEVDVANSALAKLGTYRIISLDDNTREARLIKEQFYKIRNELLRGHPWKFATTRVQLALLTTTPVFGFQFSYQLPADCMRVLEINDKDYPWEVENDVLNTDMPNACIKYVREITVPGMWDACFAETFAAKLAHDISYAVTQNLDLKKLLLAELKESLQAARTFNGQEGGTRQVYAGQWLHSRY